MDFVLIIKAEQKRKKKQGLFDMEAAYLGRVRFDMPSLTFVCKNKRTKGKTLSQRKAAQMFQWQNINFAF